MPIQLSPTFNSLPSMRLQLVRVTNCKQARGACDINASEEDAETSKVDVTCLYIGQDRLTRYQHCQQKQDWQERVAPEDVADGQLVVLHADRGNAGR